MESREREFLEQPEVAPDLEADASVFLAERELQGRGLRQEEDAPAPEAEPSAIPADAHAVLVGGDGVPLAFYCLATSPVTPQEGQSLVSDYAGYIGKVRPVYRDGEWVETATQEEGCGGEGTALIWFWFGAPVWASVGFLLAGLLHGRDSN